MSTSPELAGTPSPAELAEKYGLSKSSGRPELSDYLKELWGRRQFIVSYARARVYAAYAGARLGALWQVLTPLLNAAVYYLVFGLMLNAARNIENYTAFLISGIFVFTFTQRSVMEGTRSISANMSLIRTLHFPRATLPFAYVMNELSQLGISMGILAILVAVTEGVSWSWLLVFPALLLQTMFNIGLTLVCARLGAFYGDIAQVMPFVLRTWLYVSGVFFSIPAALADKPGWITQLIALNPAAAYIDIVRRAMLSSHDTHELPNAWWIAVAWALIALIGGFVYFWRAEDRYGRG
ncbi:MAG: ABC transporter permease [Kribbellaceae bacterium]|jgi:teichoic acid transport system permease protein|nr:ABC transporter permease [Kribbellaceae bacterium]